MRVLHKISQRKQRGNEGGSHGGSRTCPEGEHPVQDLILQPLTELLLFDPTQHTMGSELIPAVIVERKNRSDMLEYECRRFTCCRGSSAAEPGCSYSRLKACGSRKQEEGRDTAAHLGKDTTLHKKNGRLRTKLKAEHEEHCRVVDLLLYILLIYPTIVAIYLRLQNLWYFSRSHENVQLRSCNF